MPQLNSTFSNKSSGNRTVKNSAWVVVGDASRFLVFELGNGFSLTPLESFTNETAHLKISEMETDRPGRSFESTSRGHGGHQTAGLRHSYSSEQDPKEHALEKFVQKMSRFLVQEHKNNSFKKLDLIIEQRLLGMLLSSLDKSTRATVSHTYAKDFAWMSGTELTGKIKTVLEKR